MATQKRTSFNLGRLLEATSTDAPVLGWALLVGLLAGVVGASFRFGISHSEQLVGSLRTLAGNDGVLPLLISIGSSKPLRSVPASRFVRRALLPDRVSEWAVLLAGGADRTALPVATRPLQGLA